MVFTEHTEAVSSESSKHLLTFAEFPQTSRGQQTHDFKTLYSNFKY